MADSSFKLIPDKVVLHHYEKESKVSRVIDLDDDLAIESLPLSRDIQDALSVGNLERIIPFGSLAYDAILSRINEAVSRGEVIDRREPARNIQQVDEMRDIFIHSIGCGPIHLARTGNRHMAYVVRHMKKDRFVAHDVALQLMVYARDNGAGFAVIQNFLEHCKKEKLLGDVVLAMMVQTLFEDKKRETMCEELGIPAIYTQLPWSVSLLYLPLLIVDRVTIR